MEFLAEVVLIEESVTVCRNSYKNTSANSCLNLYLAHCSIPNMSFQLGSRPGMVIENSSLPGLICVESKKVACGIWKPRFQFGGVHTKVGCAHILRTSHSISEKLPGLLIIAAAMLASQIGTGVFR